ncbi:MAG: hypothetical protein ACOWWO_16670 [Peptococcaceae bacterium]
MDQLTRQVDIQPGPCPIIDGLPVCPPPTEIDIIKVKKIFDECMATQVEEVMIEFEINNQFAQLTAQCVSVEVLAQECMILSNGLVRVTATLEVTTRLDGIKESEEFSIEKIVRLERAGEPYLDVQCHIYPECLLCFVSDREEDEEETYIIVTCCIGILIVVKLEAEVQLLIPTYGYPAPPSECQEFLGECPEYSPEWPPYPPQNR